MSRLDIHTLGPLEVLLDGRSLALGTLKQRALLSLLLINRGRTVATERIVIALWGPDASPDRRSDVWVYVSRLRKALAPAGGEVIARADGGYTLNVVDEVVDASRFEALLEEGRLLVAPDPPAASLVLGEALAIWRGNAYAEFATEEFALPEVVRLEEARLTALELRIRADLAWMDPSALIPEIESVVRQHRLRPSFTESLMLALYRRGRQADALAAYGGFAKRLAADTGLEPPEELRALEERILMDDPALRPPSSALPIRLPAPIASFVGRAAELAEVAHSLQHHRLVVLTGPGGVGKTTLALEVGRRLALQFDDTAFVDLTAAEALEDVTPTVADAFRVGAQGPGALDAVMSRLGTRAVLAVLDNCEVVSSGAVGSIMTLLERAPGLRVLATSRTVLGVPGEKVLRVEPMGTEPDGDGQALLRERIAALPSSASAAVSGAEILTIVERTEGVPLAIELAAAQLSTWSAGEVIEALETPLDALVQPVRSGPERHRALRTSIAWSERLLPAPASELLARLSVFRSGFNSDAVAPVAGFGSLAGGKARQHLRRLVESSLVLVEPGEPGRYRMLGPVRDYAAQRLAEAGHADVVAERHARHYLEQLLELGPVARHPQADQVQRVHADVGNLLAAIRRTMRAGDPAEAQLVAARALPLLRVSSSLADTLAIAEEALAVSSARSKSRAELLFLAAPLWWLVRGPETWLEPIEALIDLADRLEDREVGAWAIMRRADVQATDRGEPDRALDMYRQSVTAMREARSPYLAYAYHQFAWTLLWLPERREEAERVGAEWLAAAQDLDSSFEELYAREFGIWLALAVGDHVEVEARSKALAVEYRRHGSHREAAALMSELAIASLQRGDAEEALRRIEVGLRATMETGAKPWIATGMLTRAATKVALGDRRGAAADVLASMGLAEAHGVTRLDDGLAQVAARTVANANARAAATILGAAEQVLDPQRWGVETQVLLLALDGMTGGPEEALRVALGGDAFSAAWNEGAALDGTATSALVRGSLERLIGDEDA